MLGVSGWALAVAFLALVVSIAATLFSYQQMQAARGTLKVESDRLTDERTPSFDASMITHDGGDASWYRGFIAAGHYWSVPRGR
jgi:hypothetical protein